MACFCIAVQVHAQTNYLTTVCGTSWGGYNGDGIPAVEANLYAPEGICLDSLKNIYIADPGNNRVRKVTKSTGLITTIAGNGISGFSGDDSLATNAQLYDPEAVVIDNAGNVYIADAGNNRIRKVSAATGIITTIAGSGPTGVGTGANGDYGPAINARIANPSGLCLDKSGNIYIADYGNNKIRRVDASTGIITTVAGKGGNPGYTGGFIGYSGDGGPATDAVFSGPVQVFADNYNNLFICDQWNHAVRKVDAATGIITTVVGDGTGIAGYFGDGGSATNAQLNQPCGVYVDQQENIYIADYWNGSIRKVDVTGTITTIAGTGTRGYSDDGQPATATGLKCANVFLDQQGTVYIADMDNNRIKKMYNPASVVSVGTPEKQEILSAYPNPMRDELTIVNAAESEVEIFNVTGQLSFNKLCKTDKETINVSNLVPGAYVVQITDKDGTVQNMRVVKE